MVKDTEDKIRFNFLMELQKERKEWEREISY